MGVNGARNAELLVAIRVKKRVVCRVDGLAAILAGSFRNHGLPSTIFRGRHPDPNHGGELIRFDQFSVPPAAGVNGARNSELLFAIRVKKRVVYRVDGVAAILGRIAQKSWPAIRHFPEPSSDPNRG